MKCPHVSPKMMDCPNVDTSGMVKSWACAMCTHVDIKRNKPSKIKMRKAESFIIHKYKCPICDDTHHCENQSPKYLEVWKEKCPTTDIDGDVKNNFFVGETFKHLKLDHGK